MEGLQAQLSRGTASPIALLLSKRNPECDAGHSCCDDVNPEVLHDVAWNLSDLVEHATVGGAHECQCCCPRVRSVDVDAACVAVVADHEAGEEQADDDGRKVREPDAVENGADHVDVLKSVRVGGGEKCLSINHIKAFQFFQNGIQNTLKIICILYQTTISKHGTQHYSST